MHSQATRKLAHDLLIDPAATDESMQESVAGVLDGFIKKAEQTPYKFKAEDWDERGSYQGAGSYPHLIWTALAAWTGNLPALKVLVKHGFPITQFDEKSGVEHNKPSALFCAAQQGRIKIVKYLIDECDANVNEEYSYSVNRPLPGGLSINDGKSSYAIMAAAEKDHVEVVRALLLAGANPNFENQENKTTYNIVRPKSKSHAVLKAFNNFRLSQMEYKRNIFECVARFNNALSRDAEITLALLEKELKVVVDESNSFVNKLFDNKSESNPLVATEAADASPLLTTIKSSLENIGSSSSQAADSKTESAPIAAVEKVVEKEDPRYLLNFIKIIFDICNMTKPTSNNTDKIEKILHDLRESVIPILIAYKTPDQFSVDEAEQQKSRGAFYPLFETVTKKEDFIKEYCKSASYEMTLAVMVPGENIAANDDAKAVAAQTPLVAVVADKPQAFFKPAPAAATNGKATPNIVGSPKPIAAGAI